MLQGSQIQKTMLPSTQFESDACARFDFQAALHNLFLNVFQFWETNIRTPIIDKWFVRLRKYRTRYYFKRGFHTFVGRFTFCAILPSTQFESDASARVDFQTCLPNLVLKCTRFSNFRESESVPPSFINDSGACAKTDRDIILIEVFILLSSFFICSRCFHRTI